VARRIAAYTANLVVLIVSVRREFLASSLPGDGSALRRWRSLALLWESQFGTEEWLSLVDRFDLVRDFGGASGDVVIKPVNGQVVPPVRLNGAYLSTSATVPNGLLRRQNFRCSFDVDWAVDGLEPLLLKFGAAGMVAMSGDRPVSLTRLLTTLLAAGAPDERVDAYRDLERAQESLVRSNSFYYEPVLKIMAGDPSATPDLMREMVKLGTLLDAQPDYLLICARRLLVRGGDNTIAFRTFNHVFAQADLPVQEVEVLIRCVELGIEPGAHIALFRDLPAFLGRLDLAALAEADPGLVTRLRWAMNSLDLGHLVG
jgi:hypothetical protein